MPGPRILHFSLQYTFDKAAIKTMPIDNVPHAAEGSFSPTKFFPSKQARSKCIQHIETCDFITISFTEPTERYLRDSRRKLRIGFQIFHGRAIQSFRVTWALICQFKSKIKLANILGSGKPASLISRTLRDKILEYSASIKRGVFFGKSLEGCQVGISPGSSQSIFLVGFLVKTR